MVIIDGATGEGGGQVLRTALCLSMITGTAFRIDDIRARRSKPGLKRQHLTAVVAAATLSDAEVEGAVLESRSVTFRPKRLVTGEHAFDVGTAGSATLVLQAVLPALLTASDPTTLVITGGTHAKSAPPWDFLDRAFFPVLRRMGARFEARLERHGFYPAGGGRIRVSVEPVAALHGIELVERGAPRGRRARALVANLPANIAERELHVVARELGWTPEQLVPVLVGDAFGPGNVLMLEVESEHVTEVFTGFGERGVPAEEVAHRAVREAQLYLAAGVPVGEHLADQLLLPFALAGEGRFRTLPLTLHSTTNAQVIAQFLDAQVAFRRAGESAAEVEVFRSGA